MPYADPIKKKEYYHRHKKIYDAEWKKKNRDKWNEYQRRKKDYKAVYSKIKTDPVLFEKLRIASFKYWLSHKDELNKKNNNRAETLKDTYILKLLYETEGISRETARKNPTLIKVKRILLQIKRNIKNHGN